jgi:hypothetical protein
MADVAASRVRSWTHQGWQLRLEDGLVSVIACAVGAYVGFWFVPFVIGVGAGVLSARRVRWTVIPAMTGAVVGWAISLWILALRGLPVGATARVIAALAGLPPYAGVAVAVTLLLAALQVLVGAWLARAVSPRKADRPTVTDEPPDVKIGQALRSSTDTLRLEVPGPRWTSPNLSGRFSHIRIRAGRRDKTEL